MAGQKRARKEGDEGLAPGPAPKRQTAKQRAALQKTSQSRLPVGEKLAGNSYERSSIEISDDDEPQKTKGVMRCLPPHVEGSNAFPYFDNGAVFIILDQHDIKYQYRLTKNVLCRCSPTLSKILSAEYPEYDAILKNQLIRHGYRLQLAYLQPDQRLRLKKTNFTMKKNASKPAIPSNQVSLGVPSTSETAKNTTTCIPLQLPDQQIAVEQRDNVLEHARLISEQETPSSPPRTEDSDSIIDMSQGKILQEVSCEQGPSVSEKRDLVLLASVEDLQSTTTISDGQGPQLVASKDYLPYRNTRQAYDNIFRIFYHIPPHFSSSSIENCLQQSELLLDVAERLQAINIVRPHICTALYSFGHELYRGILNDAPRFLKLGFDLQSAPIFKEAMIHVVGNFDACSTVGFEILNSLPDSAKRLIETKQIRLARYFADLERILLKANLFDKNDSPIFLTSGERENFESCIVMQLWHDEYRRNIGGIEIQRAAPFYRKLAKGGNAYLELESVRAILNSYNIYHNIYKLPFDDDARHEKFPIRLFPGLVDLPIPKKTPKSAQESNKSREPSVQGIFKDLESDLNAMKNYAKQEVKDICINQSILDPEAEGIEYFTCTKIDDTELPWIAANADNDELA